MKKVSLSENEEINFANRVLQSKRQCLSTLRLGMVVVFCLGLHAVWFIRVGRKSFLVQFLFSVTLSQDQMLCSNSDVIH